MYPLSVPPFSLAVPPCASSCAPCSRSAGTPSHSTSPACTDTPSYPSSSELLSRSPERSTSSIRGQWNDPVACCLPAFRSWAARSLAAISRIPALATIVSKPGLSSAVSIFSLKLAASLVKRASNSSFLAFFLSKQILANRAICDALTSSGLSASSMLTPARNITRKKRPTKPANGRSCGIFSRQALYAATRFDMRAVAKP